MNAALCPTCGANRLPGHVVCKFCSRPYSPELAASAIRCSACGVLSTSDQSKCVGCGGWIVVQCVFCTALSPSTAASCVKCGEVFAGAPERKAARDAEADADEEGEDFDGWEDGFVWCSKCQGLVYDEDPAGACAAGGRHETSDSESYALAVDDDEYEGEGGFRWCAKCQCIYKGGPSAGRCAATGGAHDGSESDEYVIARDGDYDEELGGWYVCNRCKALHWGEDEEGACAAGGQHDASDSSNYEVWYEEYEEE